tara:strand:+ start:62 stop:937 length:876 start_codon:yes stop_codon:yes gene_type:complete
MFKTIGIHAPEINHSTTTVIERIVKTAKQYNCRFLCALESIAFLNNESQVLSSTPEEMAEKSDLVISVGGDGTLLKCARLIYPRNVALMGINLGRLGFLTDIVPEMISDELSQILEGNFLEEERTVLECEVFREGESILKGDALNDVVIQKWNSPRLITLTTYVNGKLLHAQRSDGLIIATPTGSTAYALSGGGPILQPSLRALALVPICPHTLTNRPIVINDSALIEVHLTSDRDDTSRVTCDANTSTDLLPKDIVKIKTCDRRIRLVHPAYYDHFKTLRAKLNWGQSPC